MRWADARTVGLVAAAALIAHASPALAGNPIITDIYTADPDAFVVGDRFYIDSDQDEAPLGASDFLMRTWHMYSSTDAVNWTAPRRAAVADRLPVGEPQRVGGGDAVERDGKFYWYLPMQKAATNSMSIGVAVGDSPLGPFRDALGKPLIDNTTAEPLRVRHRPDGVRRRRRAGVHLLGLVLLAARGQARGEHGRARGPAR